MIVAESGIKKAFELKGSLFTLTVLHLYETNIEVFAEQIKQSVELAPKFLHGAPLVLDLQALPPETPLNFAAFAQILQNHHLVLVAVRGGSDVQHTQAMASGLAVLTVTKTSQEVATAVKVVSANGARKTLIVPKSVRSGQQVYAQDGDLIVLGTVSPGAELLADGHIHVYGSLRGRALAGITGDESARIFCSSLDAELISIAGQYIISETLSNNIYRKQPHQVLLEKGKLRILPL